MHHLYPHGTVTTAWSNFSANEPLSRADKREIKHLNRFAGSRKPPAISPRLVSKPRRPLAVQGEVTEAHLRCAECGRRRHELIKTLRHFTCTRCVMTGRRRGQS